MVRDAVDDGGFKTPPEVHKNCVRVYYEAGYHVDLPVYRRVTTKDAFGNETYHHELASSDWKRSDARDVTDWFEKENDAQSPDKDNGRQLRRRTRGRSRSIARSRESWNGQILSGFGITKLVTECFRGNADREDTALLRHDEGDPRPAELEPRRRAPGDAGRDHHQGQRRSRRARFLRERLDRGGGQSRRRSSRRTARARRRSSAGTKYSIPRFSASASTTRLRRPPKSAVSAPAVISSGLLANAAQAAQSAVRKEGGGRYA